LGTKLTNSLLFSGRGWISQRLSMGNWSNEMSKG